MTKKEAHLILARMVKGNEGVLVWRDAHREGALALLTALERAGAFTEAAPAAPVHPRCDLVLDIEAWNRRKVSNTGALGALRGLRDAGYIEWLGTWHVTPAGAAAGLK